MTAEENKYLAFYMRHQAERIRETVAELEKWASDLEATANRLCLEPEEAADSEG